MLETNAFEMVTHGEDGKCRILEQSGRTEPGILPEGPQSWEFEQVATRKGSH
jgi:hypothetical protein